MHSRRPGRTGANGDRRIARAVCAAVPARTIDMFEEGNWLMPAYRMEMTDYAASGRAGEKSSGVFAGLGAAGIRNVLAEGIILLAFVLTSTLLRR